MSNFGDSTDIGDSPERPGINSGTNLSSAIDSEETALSKYEHELERMINESLINGQDLYTQKLFIAFQNAAKAVTKMFRERSNGTANWNTFHAAAGSVTMLYKESLDALKDTVQLGIINGEQRKTKELLCWARRKQRRHIRTEEVYDYLIGRPPYRFASRPYNPNSSLAATEIGSTNSGTTNSSSLRRQESTTELTTSQNQPVVDDLQTFRQALVMHDIDNANRNVHSNSYRHQSPSPPTSTAQQLESFVRQQVADHLARKRDWHSADLFTGSNSSDFQKPKRGRHM
ncbi:unnamed protein product [Rotaria magnacalcarata]|uniref:Uncharacterized protein n=1 Tax=Rotaria magnacalcarata TaxID=392030 RepID=A0A816TYP2_9BILA|nr:unnamed protein product [Rotaria magnacalcarata]CAF1623566.1 unnamed protein product [Rotaria magnacalcarata]CAF2103999.1 unnamed protein product [Rotaria magnacalcarata]CAF3761912.1 unnamed protein product [Rotaria magnacalcarata]CAF3830150.1 unnamed protein product [Rotaria magnacalcarata]